MADAVYFTSHTDTRQRDRTSPYAIARRRGAECQQGRNRGASAFRYYGIIDARTGKGATAADERSSHHLGRGHRHQGAMLSQSGKKPGGCRASASGTAAAGNACPRYQEADQAYPKFKRKTNQHKEAAFGDKRDAKTNRYVGLRMEGVGNWVTCYEERCFGCLFFWSLEFLCYLEEWNSGRSGIAFLSSSYSTVKLIRNLHDRGMFFCISCDQYPVVVELRF